MTDKTARLGLSITGVVRRIGHDSFDGKKGTVESAVAILDTGRDFPDRIHAYSEERIAGLDALPVGETVTLAIYPKKTASGFSLRFIERIA